MATIRALEREDVPAVMALLRANLQGFALSEDALVATTLADPWRDDDLPSLVAVDETGGVIGFIRSQVRRMRFDGQAIRGVCCSDLVVDPGYRKGAPGALLLGRLLSGPQDVTWSDSTTDLVVRVWRTFGGDVDHARAADFMLVLHPAAWIRHILVARLRGGAIGRSLMPVGAFPAQAAGRWVTGQQMPAKAADVEGEDADAAMIAEALPAISKHLRVAVDWDQARLALAFTQIEAVSGKLTTRLVRRSGRPIGWYAYLVRRGCASRVLHLAASRHAVDAVMADLIDHATAAGSAVLTGRAEPHLEWPLRKRFAALGFAWQPVIRARDPAVAVALSSSASLLTRMDGELSPAH